MNVTNILLKDYICYNNYIQLKALKLGPILRSLNMQISLLHQPPIS